MTEALTRALGKLASFDAKARTVDVVLATETPVRRRSYDLGTYDEILTVSRQAIDTSRVDAMALLDSHDAYSGLEARIGSVVPGSLRFEGKTAIVTVKLSRNAKGEAAFRDLEDGHTLGASVGYRIDQMEKTDAPAGGVATIRATRWTPLELSIVSVPADPAASTRTIEKETEMPAEQQNLTRAERTRISEINGLARSAKIDLGGELVARAIEDGHSLDQFRADMLDYLISKEEQAPTFPISEPFKGNRTKQDELAARQEALVARLTGNSPGEQARQFMQDSLQDHARGILEANGIQTRGLTRDEIFGFNGRSAHSTSDFQNLLQGTGERILLSAYEAAESPLKTVLSRRTSIADFRPSHRLSVTDIDLLEKVSERGEIKSTTRGEAVVSYSLATYARQFSLSRNAMINDDLNALGDWAATAGRVAAETEAQILMTLLLSNPKMEDNKALFHADHGNLDTTPDALDVDGLAAARKAMRKQKAPGGKIFANVVPAYLLVGPELETTAEKVLAALNASTVSDVNPFAGKLQLLVDPRIEDRSWYVFAAPGAHPVLEWAYLTGAPGPQIATRDGWDVLGTDFRVVLDFGAGAIDWRGAYRNPGN